MLILPVKTRYRTIAFLKRSSVCDTQFPGLLLCVTNSVNGSGMPDHRLSVTRLSVAQIDHGALKSSNVPLFLLEDLTPEEVYGGTPTGAVTNVSAGRAETGTQFR